MPNLNSDFDLYLAKNEVTEGVDPTPTQAANSIELAEPFEPDDDHAFKPEAENRVRGPELHPGDPLSIAGRQMSQSRKAFLRGTSAAPTASNRIELDPWFLGAGHSATYDPSVGAEKVTYVPANTALGTITEWYYRGGKLFKYTGVRGEFGLAFDVGGPIEVTFGVQGRVSSETDAAVPTDAVFSSVAWPIATDAPVFTIDGFTAGVIRHWEHALGNVIQMRPGVKATGGIQGWRIQRRNPTFKVTLETELLATKNFLSLLTNKTPFAIAWTINNVLYNSVEFAAARAFIRKITPSNDGGLDLVTLEGVLRGATPYSLIIK